MNKIAGLEVSFCRISQESKDWSNEHTIKLFIQARACQQTKPTNPTAGATVCAASAVFVLQSERCCFTAAFGIASSGKHRKVKQWNICSCLLWILNHLTHFPNVPRIPPPSLAADLSLLSGCQRSRGELREFCSANVIIAQV